MARAGCREIGHSQTDRLRFQVGMQVDPRDRILTVKFQGLGPVQSKFKRYAVSSELLLVTSGERAGLGQI